MQVAFSLVVVIFLFQVSKLDNMDAHTQQHADNTTEVPNDPG